MDSLILKPIIRLEHHCGPVHAGCFGGVAYKREVNQSHLENPELKAATGTGEVLIILRKWNGWYPPVILKKKLILVM